MHTIFKDLVSQDYYIVSSNSIEYPDYLALEEAKKVEKVMTDTKKNCQKYLEELLILN
jgi:hypothetical protein